MATSAASPLFPLLGLPQEIQDLILSYVLGGNVIHIMRVGSESTRRDALIHTTCELSSPFSTATQGSEDRHAGLKGWCRESCNISRRKLQPSLRSSLSILQVCKQLHVAGTKALYRHNIFSVVIGQVLYIEGRRRSSILEKFIGTL